ncbi:ankyrin repeat-containing protein [Stemphylium lycopersici]|uniref:Ankyrin repeat-containing protein n=1 Tax=Stemphylium lycopersici TaxID=183478 RepID=A0A364N7X0_STELY|nr:ankyrin repeat-containing protein [Stemphylium lycopersici]
MEASQGTVTLPGPNGAVDIVSSASNEQEQRRDLKRLEPWLAVKNGNIEEVKRQLKLGYVDPNEEDFYRRTALWWAACQGQARTVGLLLANPNIDINARDRNGVTPLYIAVTQRQVELVKLLVAEQGLDVDCPSLSDHHLAATPLHMAVHRQLEEVVALLLAHKGIAVNSKDTNRNTPLHRAVIHADPSLDIVKLLLAQGDIDVNLKSSEGLRPVDVAVQRGHNELVSELLNAKGFERDSEDSVLLQEAARNGHAEVAATVLRHFKSHLNSQDSHGQAPLHVAAEYGHGSVAKVLLDAPSVEMHVRDERQYTPLFLAVDRVNKNVVKLFLKKDGVAPTSAELSFQELIRCAVRYRESEVVRLLLREQQNMFEEVDASDRGKRTLMWLAAVNKDEDMIRVLSMWDHETLHLLTENGELSLVRVLLAAGYNVNKLNDNHETALYIAVSCRQLKIAKELILRKAKVDCEDQYGLTPMRVAIIQKSSDFIELLLESSANVELIKANEWRKAYEKEVSDIIRLSKELSGSQNIGLIRESDLKQDAAACGVQRRLYGRGLGPLLKRIGEINSRVIERLDGLDQAVRDMLQLEFAWVSINETHHSTSIATSMKRLSWVTSLFGMNVNLLKNNPDWRWALLVAGVCLVSTMCAWLLFKFSKIGSWLDDHIGRRLHTATNTAQGGIGPKESRISSGQIA